MSRSGRSFGLRFLPLCLPLLAACEGGASAPPPLPVSEDGRDPAVATPAAVPVLETAFQAASARFQVPEALLKALSYAETRWYMVPGIASEFDSEAPAWGVMALRGERLTRGAALAGLPVDAVRTDPAANIAAAAALLAADARALSLDPDLLRVDAGAWAPAVAAFAPLPTEEARALFVHGSVYRVLREGVSMEEQVGRGVRLVAQPDVSPPGAPTDGTLPPAQTLVGYSGAKWLPAPASNFTDGRSAAVTLLVIHTCAGAYSGCLSWLRTPYPTNPNKTSAHYIVNESGSETAQLVDEADTAHHVGASWLGKPTNPASVGIEHGGFSYQGTNKWTEGQVAASARLACDVVRRQGIIRDRNHIIGHNQPDPVRRADDPGSDFPWADYMNRINTCIGGTTTSEIIVDTNAANNGANGRINAGALSADWKASTNVAGYWGSGYFAASTKSIADAFEFEFNLPAAGSKEVFAWWTAATDRSPTTPFAIFNAAGTKLGTVNKDQRSNGGRWVSLGRFDFSAGWNKVSVSRWTTAGAQVIADAIKVQ